MKKHIQGLPQHTAKAEVAQMGKLKTLKGGVKLTVGNERWETESMWQENGRSTTNDPSCGWKNDIFRFENTKGSETFHK